MDAMIVFHCDAAGNIQFAGSASSLNKIPKDQQLLLTTALTQTLAVIKEESRSFYRSLIKRRIQMRISGAASGTALLLPHDILLNAALLCPEKRRLMQRQQMLVGVLHRALYHWCNPELHLTQVRLYSLHFYHAHRDILKSTIQEMQDNAPVFDEPDWLESLQRIDGLMLLARFWTRVAKSPASQKLLSVIEEPTSHLRSRVKEMLLASASMFQDELQFKGPDDVKLAAGFKRLYTDHDSMVLIYELSPLLLKAVRVCDAQKMDAMSTPFAAEAVVYKKVRTEIFHDHGQWIRGWVRNLGAYSKDASLKTLEEMLLSDDLHKVRTAVNQLVKKIRRKESEDLSLRLLYSALYYWNHPDKGICRSVCLEVSALLEGILTERPFTFPPSRTNCSVFRPEPATVQICVQKPRTVRKEKVKARIQWSANGHRKKPIAMTPEGGVEEGGKMTFSAILPVRTGWLHYAVQISTDNGENWQWEELDEHSHGLLKYIADERGQRVLSFYADTLNLQLDDQWRPVRDENGLYVYGTFDDIADQLEAIRAEGYTRLYPLGALELGWAGEAGPDPSVFSVWDGKTVRRDMGGIEALLRLRQKADTLGMKVLLCVLSHFSRANVAYPYHMPVYIVNAEGKLTCRAGWDGEWSEWLDSFMVNMRDFENVKAIAQVGVELARMGFGLRIDVGHGFDAVFPAAPQLGGTARLLGQVTVPGFEPVDLRKTEEPNIPLLYMCYRIQKAVPGATVIYSEQWHGNEVRMIKAGTVPYNSLIKNLEHIRSGQPVEAPLGLNDNLRYLNDIHQTSGGQTLSLFNSHDEESPASNYQNMIWPAAAFLVLSSQGPIMYHISRLGSADAGPMRHRFDEAYTECWKHWVNNRFRHPWHEENKARWHILTHYPVLYGFGKYLRGLFAFVDESPALTRGAVIPLPTQNGRIAAFLRCYRDALFLCVFNFPNPNTEGQQAVTRNYNFLLRNEADQTPLEQIRPDRIYEVIERYNNTEGRTRRAQKEFWSGHELMHLGFGGLLGPVSSHVFELIDKTDQASREQLLLDSFVRYPRYGKQYRIRHTYTARVLSDMADNAPDSFEAFAECFVRLAAWINKKRKLGISVLSTVLAEISEDNFERRTAIIRYLMRIAVNENNRYENAVCLSAADILHGMNLGTIALISPESHYSGSAGGVGIYTTDIADVLSELGFHVVVVTPLYEAYRNKIIKTYAPRYDGHSFSIQFPEYDDHAHSMRRNTTPDIVNILRSQLLRYTHGKHTRVDVLYLENGKYLDVPYGGQTGEDKLRRARVLSQGALEALRAYNYYPTIIQTNEWPTWPIAAYLKRWAEYNSDPHFQNTRVASMMHNPHPSYSMKLDEANPLKRYYYCLVLGMDAAAHADICINPDSPGCTQIDLTYLMLKTSDHIGTVSRAMKQRILDEPQVFRYPHLFRQMEAEGRFFGRRNGFNMAARQRFWFSSQKSILETHDNDARKRLFAKYTRAKVLAKRGLQNDPNIRLCPDDPTHHSVVFSMLHRISKQKGFELLVDWKVYEDNGRLRVVYEPWKMMGPTVLEHFLFRDKRIQYVICGRVEDSFDGRRFDMHFRRIASLPDLQDRFAYYSEGSLSPSLYRNLYVGSQYFVMPSGGEVGEPCGISQQEAHAGGTPVIAHHQDGLIRTVCDADFGDTESPSNGIKFSGFNGESLLTAMRDAVEIYFNGRRLHYVDKKGCPRKLRYSDLSYNAFTTDHRWQRLLRDYIQTYCRMANVELPEHIDAVRLVAQAAETPNDELSNLILKNGMNVPYAVDCFVNALTAPVEAVRNAVEKCLLRLYAELQDEAVKILEKRRTQTAAAESEKKAIGCLLEQMRRAQAD
ncbi:MAG: glycogen/starch synthase [Planctomycetales bacterium]|nr:glycogen/starch synthase [Planctomycetales bacterium]